MGIAKAIAIAKGDQGDRRSLELHTRRKRAFEGHQIGIVQNADTYMSGVIPGIDFCPLHIAGNLAKNGESIAGARIGYKKACIF